ncbi:MAG: S1 RNA-binding domain-containing protein [Candidatus Woesearchaeota archaeon]
MFLLKQGFPEESELVLCTVTKIFHHSVFVDLDEYKKSGLIHISEVSPGRIRNIRDFVKEGKKVVCVVLKVNEDKGHIDLSLRRVNERQKKGKIEEIKQEQLAEKIVELVAESNKKDSKEIYLEIYNKISKEYGSLSEFFQEVSSDYANIDDIGIDKVLSKELTELIKQRMTPPEVTIKGRFSIKFYQPGGIDLIKKALIKGEKIDEKIKMKYSGSGKYHFIITDSNYKDAEKILDKLVKSVTKDVEKNEGEIIFEREQSK